MTRNDFTDPAAFWSAVRREKRRAARDRRAQPKIDRAMPRRSAAERTGLSGLIVRGWQPEYDASMRMRLTRDGQATAWGGEKAVCDEAKRLEQEHAD